MDLTANTAAACETVDAVYTALDSGTRDEIVKGATAEAKGDTATARRALATLQPLFTSTAATFADAAGKALDPQVKEALTALSEAVARNRLRYPVVQDNDYGTWTAYNNQYWPAEYLIDKQPNVEHHEVAELGRR